MKLNSWLSKNVSIEERPSNRLAITVELSKGAVKNISLAAATIIGSAGAYAILSPIAAHKHAVADTAVFALLFYCGMRAMLKSVHTEPGP